MRNQRDHTSKPMSEVLAETFERGDQTSIGHALNIPPQHVQEWTVEGARRNPFDATATIIETLRANKNSRADEPFLILARRLGFIVYRAEEVTIDDKGFAAVLSEVSELVTARAEAESEASDGGKRWTPAERYRIADVLDVLIQRAAAYRDLQRSRAQVDEQRIRRVQ